MDRQGLDESAHGGVAKPKATFLSHSREDHKLAEELCASLEASGFSCWIAPRNVAPGQPYALACLEGVAQSLSLLLLASETALASVQVLSEVEQAHKRAMPIYTVLIPPAKVRGEMDFYLSRLHWIESGGRTPEQIAAKLAQVLNGQRGWNEVASPPTLHRTMRYRPMAFARMVAATVIGLLLIIGSLLFAVNHQLNANYLRWGYVDLTAEATDGGRVIGHARVWVMAPAVPFAAVRLLRATRTSDGRVSHQEFKEWPVPEQVGSQEMVAIPLERGARQVTTCMIVPSSGRTEQYRVTQQFLLTQGSDGVLASESAEKQVSKEDGSPCG